MKIQAALAVALLAGLVSMGTVSDASAQQVNRFIIIQNDMTSPRTTIRYVYVRTATTVWSPDLLGEGVVIFAGDRMRVDFYDPNLSCVYYIRLVDAEGKRVRGEETPMNICNNPTLRAYNP